MRLMTRLRQNLNARWTAAKTAAPRTTMAVLVSTAVLAVVIVVGGGWYLTHLVSTLPDQQAIGRIGEMDQATAVFRRARSARVHDLQGTADRRSARRRFRRTSLRRSSRSKISGSTTIMGSISSASRRRRSPTSATAVRAQGGSTITQQLARQSFLTPNKTSAAKCRS